MSRIDALSSTLPGRGTSAPVVRSRMRCSSSRSGKRTRILKKKRSSCASGRGYVPSILDGVLASRGRRTARRASASACPCSPCAPAWLRVARALGLGCRAVDFVGKDNVREHRTFAEFERFPRRPARLVNDRRAQDVRRHEVGGELNSRKRTADSVSASVRTSIVLPSPGTPFEQWHGRPRARRSSRRPPRRDCRRWPWRFPPEARRTVCRTASPARERSPPPRPESFSTIRPLG